MLIETLVEEFESSLNQEINAILWFDPDGEWQGLLEALQERLPLHVYDGSQLELRYKLATREAGERAVIYLPLAQEKAEYLRPYFYTGKVFKQSIEKTLWKEGVSLPDDAETRRKLRPLLPALAAASVGKGRPFWEGIVNLETAFGRLVTDFDQRLMQLLAYTQRTMSELQREQLAKPFFELVRSDFGVAGPSEGQESAWANRFTAVLCLTDLYEAARERLGTEPPDFPFLDTLPAPAYRARCRSFLHKWQHHDIFKAAFKQRARAVDAQYPVGSWAAGLGSLPIANTFLNVERALWDVVQQELQAIADKPEAIAFAQAYDGQFQHRAKGFWAREGEMSGWRILAQMTQTILQAQAALKELGPQLSATNLVERYIEEWWQIDRSYRRFRTELDSGTAQLDAALKWTGRIYEGYLNEVNERFTAALQEAAEWPTAGQGIGLADLWEQSESSTDLRALVLVDALRFELAHDLAERLEVDPGHIESGLSALPSITEVGMATLLPEWPDFDVGYQGKDWVIAPPGSSKNVAVRQERVSWLADKLAPAAVFDLDEWLSTPLNQLDQDVRWLVVTSTMLDNVGEGAGTVIMHTFDSLLRRLEQAVRRLKAAGCAEIHIVTDHGFLLREAIRESDKVQVNVEGILRKRERYLIGRDLPPTDLPHFPVSNSQDLVAWFPRGIGCFATPGPYNYMHGGISLQETVVPHITTRQSLAESLVGVSLHVLDGPEVRNAIFKVHLVPEGVDLLSKPRQVIIDIVKDGQRVSRVWEERVERETVERSLMLEPEYGLMIGDQLQVRLRDATTDELLDEEVVVCQVDLEL